MDARWWPGLGKRLPAIEAHRRASVPPSFGQRFRHWNRKPDAAPANVRLAAGVGSFLGAAIVASIVGAGSDAQARAALGGLLFAPLLVDGWYALGVRHLRRRPAAIERGTTAR